MAFLPQNFYHPVVTPSLAPLIRFLDDTHSYTRQYGPVANTQCRSRRTGETTFQPKFDVREIDDVYELYGELPGVDKENVQIEFTDPQVMVVRGEVERTYTTGTPSNNSSSPSSAQDEDTTMSASDTEQDEPQRKDSHQATVEDEAEADDNESGFEKIENPEKQVEKVTEKTVEQQPFLRARYWMAERSIGQFSRSFKFPDRVDQDSVSASFHNGILTVTVPKAKKHESRRIVVN